MRLRTVAIALAVVVAAGVAGATGFYLSYPENRVAVANINPATPAEVAQTLTGLKPPKRSRPLIAVVGANEGSETTDYLIPYGVLKRSGVADVVSLGVGPGPVQLMPALTVVPDATIAEFDRQHPDGADYVIVPALHNASNRALIAWLKAQSSKRATIVGICAGAWVLANAGLLDGREATTIWASVAALRAQHPSMRYVPNRRYVVDRGVVTTTGVSASLPLSLALVEAIAGRERATALARDLGAPGWNVEHASAAFHATRSDVWAMVQALASLRPHETVGIPIAPGVDEVSLAFRADAYANTNLTRVMALADGAGPIATANGMRLIPDGPRASSQVDLMLTDVSSEKPVAAFERAFAEIAARYGRDYASLSRLSLEYPESHSQAAVTAAGE